MFDFFTKEKTKDSTSKNQVNNESKQSKRLIEKLVATQEGRHALKQLMYTIHLRATDGSGNSDNDVKYLSTVTNYFSNLVLGSDMDSPNKALPFNIVGPTTELEDATFKKLSDLIGRLKEN